jgi:predicted transcriptional regulator
MRRGFRFWGHRTPQQIVESRLGVREREVMAVVWAVGEISARGACSRLAQPIAYTTVGTTLDRLFKKGLLARRKVGQAFLYRAAVTRAELEHAIAADLLDGMFDRQPDQPLPVLSSLVDALGARDHALLDELERLIHEKRQTLPEEEP